jgi:hypothetical protein
MMSQPGREITDPIVDRSPSQNRSDHRDLTGRTLGDFRLQRLLGRGGMGDVYLATQLSLNRPVALKILHPHFGSSPSYLSRFEKEAKAVARLNHPNILHVYSHGEVEGLHYLAMEYVPGWNLREYILKKGTVELPLALSIIKQAGQAIAAAGEVGLVHRDIKPENLLLTRKGRVKVADFGLCRDLEADAVHVTQPGITVGTPLYMSPEQARGMALDHRSDLYSLGVTIYHMLTGEPPFRADSPLALAIKHLKDTPVPPRVYRPEIPPELEALVLKLMAKDPAERYQSAEEMLSDLAQIRAAWPTTSRSLARTVIASGEVATETRLPTSLEKVRSQAAAAAADGGRPVRVAPLAGLALVTMMLGAGAGLLVRPSPAALGEAGLQTERPPALDLDPDWSRIPRQANPEAQYRHALLNASGPDLAAAWLAVAGYFPAAHPWVSPAYRQLARQLYRERDREGLALLAEELASWPKAKTADAELVEILGSALKLLESDVDGVIEGMSRLSGRDDRTIIDPGLLEFSIEIVADAIRLTSRAGMPAPEIKRDRLIRIQIRLMNFLRRVRWSEWLGR